MRRRRFLSLLGAAGAAAALPRPPGGRQGPRHWTWVHGNREGTTADWRGRFARVRAAGIEGVLVGGGDTAILAGAARAEGLAFHRWIWVLNRTGDAWAKATHPEWFSVSRTGHSSLTTPPYVGYYQWVCPTRAPVREYLGRLAGKAAAEPGVDGVHLDYIRHPDVILPRGLWAKYGLVQDHEMPEFDFCYCEVCRAAFRAEDGRDPLGLADPAADRAWREFRWAGVTRVVTGMSAAVRGQGKEITAAVFPTPALARQLVRQEWDRWPLDRVFPMLYHGFYQEPVDWIGRAARAGVDALAGRLPLCAGLYLPDLPPAALAAAVGSARDGGAAGVALFEMAGLGDDHLAVLRRELW